MQEQEYQSSWEWTRQRSAYHFDYTKRDRVGDYFFPLGRFVGDWTTELSSALAGHNTAITWATRKYSPYFTNKYGQEIVSDMLQQEEYDLEAAGYKTDLELSDVVEQEHIGPILTKIYNTFELHDPWVRLHIQRPGQMFNLHIDKLYHSEIIRIVVNLTDWEPGQFYQYGTYTHSHWSAGDVHTFDWQNVPHATANASRSVRPTLIFTGVKSERTKELLAAATSDTRYYL